MDGSQKLPQRMLDSIRWHLLVHGSDFYAAGDGRCRLDALRQRGGRPGQEIEISDPLLPIIQQTVQNSADRSPLAPRRLRAICRLKT